MAPRGGLAREEGAEEGAVCEEQERKELNGSIPPPPEFPPPPPSRVPVTSSRPGLRLPR